MGGIITPAGREQLGFGMAWILKPQGLVEPVPAPEFFIDGVGAIEECNGLLRVFYYAHRTCFHSDENVKQVEVVLRRPISSVEGTMRDAIARWKRETMRGAKRPYLVG